MLKTPKFPDFTLEEQRSLGELSRMLDRILMAFYGILIILICLSMKTIVLIYFQKN